jgi:hypothetical protein
MDPTASIAAEAMTVIMQHVTTATTSGPIDRNLKG